MEAGTGRKEDPSLSRMLSSTALHPEILVMAPPTVVQRVLIPLPVTSEGCCHIGLMWCVLAVYQAGGGGRRLISLLYH